MKMKIIHETQGAVCAHTITVEIDEANKIIGDVVFYGGCQGNHLGISALVKGMTVSEAVKRLSGICCGSRTTSCPDQLAQALKKAL